MALARGGTVRNLVWVYGTLKRGFSNHEATGLGAGTCSFVGSATTTDRYPLLILSEYNIPFLLDVPGRGQQIEGEIYDVDDAMLTILDHLEGHPDFYLRRNIAVTPSGSSDALTVQGWVNKSKFPLCLFRETGCWI
eukprot:m.775538 g.775538  ORF g.775538 m.775538 type:complete len:136 (+) comp23259_c0_seq54:258-665(+)